MEALLLLLLFLHILARESLQNQFLPTFKLDIIAKFFISVRNENFTTGNVGYNVKLPILCI